MKTLCAALAAVVLFAACGGDEDTSPTTAPVAGGARFEAIVEPVNCAIGAAMQQTNSPDVDWTDLRSIARNLARTEGDFVDQVTAERWPATAEPAVRRLADAAADQAAGWREASSKTTEAEVLEAINRIDPATTGKASAEARKALGLQPLDPNAPCPGHGG